MQSEYEKFYVDLYGTVRKIPKKLEKNIDDVFIELGKRFEKRYRRKNYAYKAFSSICYLYGFNNFPKKEIPEILEIINEDEKNTNRKLEERDIYRYNRHSREDIYISPYYSNIIHYGKKKADRWLDHPEEQKLEEMHIRDFFKEGRLGNPLMEFCQPVKCCYITDIPYAIEQRRIELSKGKDFELTTIEALNTYKPRIYPKLMSEILEKLDSSGMDIINHNVISVDDKIKENPELSKKKVSFSVTIPAGDRKKLRELADQNGMRVNDYLSKLIKEEYEKSQND